MQQAPRASLIDRIILLAALLRCALAACALSSSKSEV